MVKKKNAHVNRGIIPGGTVGLPAGGNPGGGPGIGVPRSTGASAGAGTSTLLWLVGHPKKRINGEVGCTVSKGTATGPTAGAVDVVDVLGKIPGGGSGTTYVR